MQKANKTNQVWKIEIKLSENYYKTQYEMLPNSYNVESFAAKKIYTFLPTKQKHVKSWILLPPIYPGYLNDMKKIPPRKNKSNKSMVSC